MYEITKDDMIGQVTITKDYIEKKGSPLITMRESGEAKLLTQRESQKKQHDMQIGTHQSAGTYNMIKMCKSAFEKQAVA